MKYDYDTGFDFPSDDYQHFVGKTVAEVLQTAEGDEGLRLVFTDGSLLEIYFSDGAGEIFHAYPQQ